MGASAVSKVVEARGARNDEENDDDSSRIFWNEMLADDEQGEDLQRRRSAELPYCRDEDGRLTVYDEPVSDGGCLSGVLVDNA